VNKMAKSNKMPDIRFSGYTNAWEQRKLGECMSSFAYGLNAAAKEYDGMHKYIRITDIDDETHNFIQSNLTSPDIDFNMDVSDYKLNVGDIVFARTGASVGKTYLYNPNDGDLYYAGFLIRGKVKEDCDAGFIYQNTLTKDYDSFIKITSQRSGQPGVNSKEYATFRLNIPCKDEQEKISKVLNSLDELFTLHQRKLEKLKLTKKALLQKLFPQNEGKIPELRFKGFTDAWEQRKLESLFTKYEDKISTPDSGYWRLGLRSHCKGTFHTYVDAGHELETTEMYRVKAGNFILNITFAWERALAVTDDEDQGKLVSHRFPQFKPNDDLVIDFFKHTLMDKRFKHHLELSSPGGAGRNKVLKVSDMLKYELLVPSIQEQNIISSFLNNVDYIITLHQRKLEMLKNVKKGLLQKMFV
jgi:type I restriction modification DNA specificity domain protein